MRSVAAVAILISIAAPVAAQGKSPASTTIQVANADGSDGSFDFTGTGKNVSITSSGYYGKTDEKVVHFKAPARFVVDANSSFDLEMSATSPGQSLQLTFLNNGREVSASGPKLHIKRAEGQADVKIEAAEVVVR